MILFNIVLSVWNVRVILLWWDTAHLYWFIYGIIKNILGWTPTLPAFNLDWLQWTPLQRLISAIARILEIKLTINLLIGNFWNSMQVIGVQLRQPMMLKKSILTPEAHIRPWHGGVILLWIHHETVFVLIKFIWIWCILLVFNLYLSFFLMVWIFC